MRLDHFRGEGLHGFLRFKIDFHKDLTFLTGNNGGGKTTALNAIIALLVPDLSMLAALEFSSLHLDLTENDGTKLKIAAYPTDLGIRIEIEGQDSFTFNKFVTDPDGASYRSNADSEREYYQEIISVFSTNSVLRKISSLPTPMFLGLDRRPKLFWDEGRRPRFPRSKVRNPFAGSLNVSIIDAANLAEDRNREAIIQSSRVLEELQQQMLLNLITPVPGEASDFLSIKLPSAAERAQLKTVRRNLSSIATILRLSHNAVNTRLRPLLDKLDDLAKAIPSNMDFEKIFGPGAPEENQKYAAPVLAWTANAPHLDRIVSASEVAEQFNLMRLEATRPIELYRKLINDFLVDSGKEIFFNEKGEIEILLDGIEEPKSISQLSSGEAQLFVILTYLSLNQTNVSKIFIIDEPELSLHLRWQELFVDSLIAANSSVQYVLATHSPSIILDRTSRCIDVTDVRGRRRLLRKK